MPGPGGSPLPDPQSLAAYAGRWVAILRGRVVGQGGTPRQALQSAKTYRHKDQPEIHYVPTTTPLTFSSLLEQIRPALPQDVPVYLIGGAVRDALLGRPTHDLDFALPGDGIRIARQVADALQAAFYPLDTERGTGRVILSQPAPTPGGQRTRTMLDFATFRGPDLESDLRARDFTINAMGVDARDPEKLLDPLGGAADLLARRLRACSPSAFQDDPLRILRAVRLATAYELHIAPETRQQIRQALPNLEAVSPERLRDELLRILGGKQVAAALRALERLGVFPYLLPELIPLQGVTQSPPHVDDVWNHTLQTVQHLEGVLNRIGRREHDPEGAANLAAGLMVLRLGRYRQQIYEHIHEEIIPDHPWRALLFLAALYHDTGKPATRQADEDGRIRFFGHEEAGARLISHRAQQFHLSAAETSRLVNVVRHHMRPHLLAQTQKLPTRRAIYRFFRDTRQAGVDICLLALADTLATYGAALPQDVWRNYLDVIRELLEAYYEKAEERLSPPALITGHDLMRTFGLAPGPIIGELLEQVREAQADGQIASREQALRWVKDQLEQRAG